MMITRDRIGTFKRLFDANCQQNEAYDIICSLDPGNIDMSIILEIIDWVENQVTHPCSMHRHVSIFGTGGDCPDDYIGKTLNLSSIVATLASKWVTVIKVGTRGVTAKWGSADYFKYVECLSESEIFPFRFYKPSRFIDLKSLGFNYTKHIVEARKRLFAERKLDIFKVIFPFSNLTGSYGQVNGVSRLEYFDIYSELAKTRPDSKILILYNEFGHDEILPGRNKLSFNYKGNTHIFDIFIDYIPKEYLYLFHQKDTIEDQVKASIKLLQDDRVSDIWLKILSVNAATLLTLDRSDSFSSLILDTFSKIIEKEVRKNYA